MSEYDDATAALEKLTAALRPNWGGRLKLDPGHYAAKVAEATENALKGSTCCLGFCLRASAPQLTVLPARPDYVEKTVVFEVFTPDSRRFLVTDFFVPHRHPRA